MENVDDNKQVGQEKEEMETYPCDLSKSSTGCIMAILVPISFGPPRLSKFVAGDCY